MKAFEYRNSDGEIKGLILGETLRTGMSDPFREVGEDDEKDAIWVFNADDRLVAILTLDDEETLTEKVPEPDLVGAV